MATKQHSLLNIAWFSPVILSEAAAQIAGQTAEGGTWIDTLFALLRSHYQQKAHFHIFHPTRSVKKVRRLEGTQATYYLIPQRKYPFLDDFKKERALMETELKRINPDLLHVHGTEEFFGLLTEAVSCPAVISLQGFREDIYRAFFSDISLDKYLWLNLRRGKWNALMNLWFYRRMVKIEARIFAQNQYFIGRTEYDRLHTLGKRPDATYFGDCHDILRPAFLKANWLGADSHPFRIHTTLTERTYKGIFLLIDTVEILKRKYPEVSLTIAGGMRGTLGKYARKVVAQKGLADNVHFLGRCSPEQMITALQEARVFVLGSYVENESLSLQEAQAIGLPAVVPYIGGVISMLTHEQEGLFYPIGDPYYFAGMLGRVFDSETLALKMGAAAKVLFLRRNHDATIARRYAAIYQQLLNPDKTISPQPSTINTIH